MPPTASLDNRRSNSSEMIEESVLWPSLTSIFGKAKLAMDSNRRPPGFRLYPIPTELSQCKMTWTQDLPVSQDGSTNGRSFPKSVHQVYICFLKYFLRPVCLLLLYQRQFTKLLIHKTCTGE